MIITLNTDKKNGFFRIPGFQASFSNPKVFDAIFELNEKFRHGEISVEEFESKIKFLIENEDDSIESYTKILEDVDSNKIKGVELSQGRLFLKGTNIPIPISIVNIYNETKDVRYLNFWKWAIHNPTSGRDELIEMIKDYKIQILSSGLLLMYRRVNTADPDLTYRVFTEYNRLRKAKKGTDVLFEKGTWTVKELYEKINMRSNYDPNFQYVLNEEKRIPLSAVDQSGNECGPGLHSGGPKYCYSGFGNTPVVCIVNPMDMVKTFKNGYHKTRSCALTIISVLKEDAEWADFTPEQLDEISQVNHKKQLKKLKGLIAKGEYPQVLDIKHLEQDLFNINVSEEN